MQLTDVLNQKLDVRHKGRVGVDRAAKLLGGNPISHSKGKEMNGFGRAVTQQMCAQNSAGTVFDQNLGEYGFLSIGFGRAGK